MKFIRRTEGVKASRAVFKRARADPRVKFHVYVAAATMEYYCSKVGKVKKFNLINIKYLFVVEELWHFRH